jgi:Mg2+ and Co2+ transporter CorA
LRYRQMLVARREVISNLVQSTHESQLQANIKIAYFRDVYDHILMMISAIEITLELLSSLEAGYLARASIEVAVLSYELSDVTKKLGSFATIVLPITFITSIFSMNVFVPWSDSTSLVPFFVIIGTIILILLFQLIFYRYINWL